MVRGLRGAGERDGRGGLVRVGKGDAGQSTEGRGFGGGHSLNEKNKSL